MKKNEPKRNERNAVRKRMSLEIKTSFKFHFLVIFFFFLENHITSQASVTSSLTWKQVHLPLRTVLQIK